MASKVNSLPIADPHTHILPKMDDGSKNVEESLNLLRKLKEQNVACVAATPHFYSNRVKFEEFLRRREKSYAALRAEYTPELPEIRLGAEVTYFTGISHSEEVLELKIEGTPLLLVEMPFSPWSQQTVSEIAELNYSGKARVLLAHIERYQAFQRPAVWRFLLESGILMQSNADHMLSWYGKRRGIRMFREGRLHVLGSDCHSMDRRPPKLGEAKEELAESDAEDVIEELNRFYRYFFVPKTPSSVSEKEKTE